jgi:hypothetical protein
LKQQFFESQIEMPIIIKSRIVPDFLEEIPFVESTESQSPDSPETERRQSIALADCADDEMLIVWGCSIHQPEVIPVLRFTGSTVDIPIGDSIDIPAPASKAWPVAVGQAGEALSIESLRSYMHRLSGTVWLERVKVEAESPGPRAKSAGRAASRETQPA